VVDGKAGNDGFPQAFPEFVHTGCGKHAALFSLPEEKREKINKAARRRLY
jgi:hypothetical protein